MIGNLRKKKVDCSKRPSEKKIEKNIIKWSWTKAKEKKKEKKKKKKGSKSTIWALLCKVSGIDVV